MEFEMYLLKYYAFLLDFNDFLNQHPHVVGTREKGVDGH